MFLILAEEGVKHEFQSETQMLLQIVAKSLYSNKEVTSLLSYMKLFKYFLIFRNKFLFFM